MKQKKFKNRLGDDMTGFFTDSHEEWLSLRNGYEGGSDAGTIAGFNQFSSPYKLWAEKTGKLEPFGGNIATEVGTFMEEFVAQKFAAETGKKVRNNHMSMVNARYPWAIANVDRDIVGEDAGLECKTTSAFNIGKFKDGVEFPLQYYCQCLHYLAVTGKQKWYLAVLIGNSEFKTYCLDRDEEEIAALMDMEKHFHEEYVLKDVPPPVDGADATTETIANLYSTSNGDSVDLFGLDYAMARYLEIGVQEKELKAEKEECANTIKSALGDAETGIGERYRATWKSSVRTNFNSKAYMKDFPDADYTKYLSKTESRTFKVSEL